MLAPRYLSVQLDSCKTSYQFLSMKMFETSWTGAESSGLGATSCARSLKDPRPDIMENFVRYFQGSEGDRVMVVDSCFELMRGSRLEEMRKRSIDIDLLLRWDWILDY